MKRLFLCLAAGLIGVTGLAQQLPLYGQYALNPYLYNPAAAGQGEAVQVLALYRNQWAGIPGAPETQALLVNGPVRNQKMGLGFTAYNDVTNVIGRTGFLGTYAYRLQVARAHFLSFGVSAGAAQQRIYFERIRAQDPYEQSLLANAEHKTAFDGNCGVLYTTGNFQAGLAAHQLFRHKLTYRNRADFRQLDYRLVNHYTASLQYRKNLGQTPWSVTPTLLLRSVQGLPVQFDLNATARWHDKVWFGLSYRQASSVGASWGALIDDRLTIGYGYELPVGAVAGFSSGSHEVALGYRFGHGKAQGRRSQAHDERLEKLAQDNAEQYEKIDQLQQTNEQLSRDVQKQQQRIEQLEAERKQLEELLAKDRAEIGQVVQRAQVPVESKSPELSPDAYHYYVVVGTFKRFDDAKAFQKILQRDFFVPTSVVENDRPGIYHVYVKQVQRKREAVAELKRADRLFGKELLNVRAWVYQKLK